MIDWDTADKANTVVTIGTAVIAFIKWLKSKIKKPCQSPKHRKRRKR